MGFVSKKSPGPDVAYIPKSSKDTYFITKSYKPILQMNCLLKGLERVSVWLADTVLEDNSLNVKSQNEHQEGKSTKTARSNVW